MARKNIIKRHSLNNNNDASRTSAEREWKVEKCKEIDSKKSTNGDSSQLYHFGMDMKKVLVTGSAGFIGANLVLRLLESQEPVMIFGLDNLNNYYDPSLKDYRLGVIDAKVGEHPEHRYSFTKGSIADRELINRLFREYQPDIVVNLAAQAGVRYSIENPDVYIESNIIGFYNILEACRHHPVEHLVYASSSSVYGGNKKVPFSTDDRVDNPVSLYAATKKTTPIRIQLTDTQSIMRLS